MTNPFGSTPMWVSESTSQACGQCESPGLPPWCTLLAWCLRKVRLRWAFSYIFTRLLSPQGTFLGQNLWERGGTKCDVTAFYKWRSVIWQLISFLVTILSEPRVLFSNSQSLMEPSLIFLGIKPCFSYLLRLYQFE